MESRKEFITDLITKAYDKYDFLRVDPLDSLIDKALSIYLDSDLSNDEIKDEIFQKIITRKKEIDFRYDPEKVKKNHKIIYSRLKELVHLLNENKVDYQVCGALSGYIKYGESKRVHEDIDININEKDIDKFKKICISLGYDFEDNRLNSPRVLKNGIPAGEHEIIARDPDSDFHIGAFAFERMPDGSVINKLYYTDEQGNPCVREELYSPEFAKEIFPRESVMLDGERVFITPPEFVYSLKEYTQGEKDKHDIVFFKDKINKDRYKRIKRKAAAGKIVRHIPVYGVDTYEDNPFAELNSMMEEEPIQEMTAPGIEAKPKQITKEPDNSGYTNSLIIILLTMVCLGFLVMSIIITRTLG